jgi:metal-dependent hydrolase (beta-lactamase superfamily II)
LLSLIERARKTHGQITLQASHASHRKTNSFRQIITALKEINPDYLMPAHYTGEPFYDMVRREMPGKVFQSNVGTLFTFTA